MPILSNKDKHNEIQKTALESNKLRYIAYKKQEAIIMNKDVLGLCKYLYKNIYIFICFKFGDDDKWQD